MLIIKAKINTIFFTIRERIVFWTDYVFNKFHNSYFGML